MKKLPKIYQAEFNKNITNNKKVCYLKEETENDISNRTNNVSIITKIDEIFSGLGYSYNIPLIIKTKDQKYETSLIAKTNNNVVTLENEIIPISEIIDIQQKKNV